MFRNFTVEKSNSVVNQHESLPKVITNVVFDNTSEEKGEQYKLVIYPSAENLLSVPDGKERELTRTPSIFHLNSEKKIFAKSLKTKYSNVDYFSDPKSSSSLDSLSIRPGQMKLVQASQSSPVERHEWKRRWFDRNSRTSRYKGAITLYMCSDTRVLT